MDKIKRFIDCYIPVTSCTLRCHYCYITHHRLFDNKIPQLNYSPAFIRKALSKERLGGVCLINMCAGGETLLSKEVVDYTKALLEEGHYVMIVTNGTLSKSFNRFAEFPSQLTQHLFFKFSYHYIELKKRDLLITFFSNIQKVKEAGCSFTLEATPSDELINYIDEMKEEAYKNVGAINHVSVGRDERQPDVLPILTNMSWKEYKSTWSTFKSKLFDYKMTIFGEKRNEFCYAGDWSFYLNIGTGEMSQCYCSFYQQNIFEDISKPIRFIPIGNNCKLNHCYNGHVFLTLGNIPNLKAPTYSELRNRICPNSKEWLKPEMKDFMNTKLFETNKEYSFIKKLLINRKIRKLAAKESRSK